MKIRELIELMNDWAHESLQESYDNAGLLCGDPDREVTGVLCTLDCTEEVVREAMQRNCNVVLAHHPIVFKGLKSITGKNYVERTIITAIQNDVAIYAAHTNLDHVADGVNREIGKRLGASEMEILQPASDRLLKLVTFVPHTHLGAVKSAIFNAGAGTIGRYDHCSYQSTGEGSFRALDGATPFAGSPGLDHLEPENRLEVIVPSHRQKHVEKALRGAHPYEEPAYDWIPLRNKSSIVGSGMIGTLPSAMDRDAFLQYVAACLHAPVIRYTASSKSSITRVAWCGGSGSFLLSTARARGADAFITGDFKYHEFFDAEGNILVADIGHFESEQFTPHLMQAFLLEKNVTFAVLLSGVKTNPVQYYISQDQNVIHG